MTLHIQEQAGAHDSVNSEQVGDFCESEWACPSLVLASLHPCEYGEVCFLVSVSPSQNGSALDEL